MANGIYADDGSYRVTIIGGSVEVDPTGLATDTKQDTQITSLQLIDDVVFAIDVAAGGSDKGIPPLAIRDDALTTLTPADGDYTNLRVDSTGRLYVVSTVSAVVPGTTATNLGKAVDTAAGATDTGVAALPVRDDALAALTPVDGDYDFLRVDKWGRLHVRQSLDEYETVAASQTAQTLGATGASGDIIAGILVIPATVSPGNVLLLDNATSITVFAGGTNSVLTLHPFYIPLGLRSVSGAWKITTGADVSCIGIGEFT